MAQDENQGTGIFAGGSLHVSDSPQAILQAHSVAADTDVVARSGLATAQAGERAMKEAVALMDYKERADGLLGLQKAQRDGEQALQLGLTAPYGSEESFYHEDGTVNSAKVEDFKLQLADVYDQVEPRFVSPEARAEWDVRKLREFEDGMRRMVGKVQREELKNIRSSGEAVMASLLGNGEYQGAVAEAEAQFKAGVKSLAERNEAIRAARAAQVVAGQRGSFVPGAGVRRSGGRRRSGGGGHGGAPQEQGTGAGAPKVKITLF